MLSAHTPVSTVCDTRVTTHLALRDKAEHSEHARVFGQWASPILCKIYVDYKSETVHILFYIERFRHKLLNAFDAFQHIRQNKPLSYSN